MSSRNSAFDEVVANKLNDTVFVRADEDLRDSFRVTFIEKETSTSFGKLFSRTTSETPRFPSEVVLIPGMIISGRYMIPLAKELAPFYRCHIIDLPESGRSEKTGRSRGVNEIADALHEWLISNRFLGAHFVANSFGCQVLAELAARYPDSASRLILQGPTVDPSARTVLRQYLRLRKNSKLERKSVGVISAKDYWAAGAFNVVKTIKITLQDRIEDKLPLVQVPTLVVRGQQDPVVPQEWAEEVTRLLPHGTLRVLEEAAHSLNFSEARRFAEIIREFLESEAG